MKGELDALSPVKRALLELREMRARVDELEGARSEAIAIIGMACRFPGHVDTPDAFWTLLSDGRDAITEIPASRWNAAEYFDADPDAPGKMYTRHGGFVDGIDTFDARFFGITPREAERLDPQQRLLLEVAWEAFERAGIAPDRLIGNPTGVFVGLSAGDYMQLQMKLGDPNAIDAYMASGSSPAVASGRLSYVLGVRGPSMTVDTACSSSLAAVHLACQSLRNRECDMALAGGVSLILMPEINVNFSKARMMAPDGKCKTFDAAADGYVRSEGCGAVVLKRLSDVQPSDRVVALIRGSALNQDGRSSGLTVPNGPAQEAVVREALTRAGVAPADVDYIEAHGTGTSLGDPIEVNALGAVFTADRPANRPLWLGSVKTNIGHLEAAAGVAGLIKVVLAMQHGEVPPHLHFNAPNPHVAWNTMPIVVPTTATPWPLRGGRRVAGVSSFGFSGTNAHIVVESAPARAEEPRQSSDRSLHVLPLSAKSAEALRTTAVRMSDHLAGVSSGALADVCFTAGTGRAHFAHRAAVVTDSTDVAREALAKFAAGESSLVISGAHLAAAPPEIGFLFTGQGAQYVGMGRSLYETAPVFRQTMDRCDEVLRPHLDRSILDVMFDRGGAGELLDQTAYTQPALFALEYSVVELWRSWGITPSVVMGHSLGEDVAACVAGVYSLEDGLALMAARGRLMQALPKSGEMHAVFASEARVRAVLASREADLSVAAVNAPEQVTISGRSTAMAEVLQVFARDGIRTKALVASHAFHSPLMDPMLEPFERCAAAVSYHEPHITLISNVSGTTVAPGQVSNAQYWRRHVREPVRFSESIQTMWGQGCRIFVEIGPNPVLVGLGQRTIEEGGVWLTSLRKGRDDWREILTTLATVYTQGARVDWQGVELDANRRTVALPTYPFQRERHWVQLRDARQAQAAPPLWPRIADAAKRQSLEGPFDLAIGTYAAKWDRLNELARDYIVNALRRFGACAQIGEGFTTEDLRVRFGVAETYRGLLRRWLDMLAGAGYLDQADDRFVVRAPLPAVDPQALVERSRDLFVDYPSVLDYMERCGTRLTDVLTGRESALETLFPGGSTTLADALYGTSALARYFNSIVRAAVLAAAQGAVPERPLRILEIGAGTGGTTSGLIPTLPSDRVRYCFTDVGPLFLSRARERFASTPFMTYRMLDIEKHPREQGFGAHEFDVVIAANVLHATRNLHDTLEHVAWLMGPSGVLIMYEATRHPHWFDITTGLISGWQRFDDDLRTDVPLVAPAVWERALLGRGYQQMLAFPQDGTPAEVLGQHVLVARGPAVAAYAHEAASIAGQQPDDSLAGAAVSAPLADTPDEGFRERLASMVEHDRREALVSFVRDRVMRVLRLDPSQAPDRQQRLMDLGVDSLMAVEFRNVLTAGLALDKKLPATLIFDYPTIDAVADYLRSVLALPQAPAGQEARDDGAEKLDLAAAELEDLDDEEVEALLNKRLESL